MKILNSSPHKFYTSSKAVCADVFKKLSVFLSVLFLSLSFPASAFLSSERKALVNKNNSRLRSKRTRNLKKVIKRTANATSASTAGAFPRPAGSLPSITAMRIQITTAPTGAATSLKMPKMLPMPPPTARLMSGGKEKWK